MATTSSKANKKQWCADEDDHLLQMVQDFGITGSWPTIGQNMDNRSGKQCRERYMNHLDPLLKKTIWTHDEDEIIMRIHRTLGHKWSQFVEHLPGRSDNSIKNRFHIISRDNFTEHNIKTVKRDQVIDSIVKTGTEGTVYVPETIAIRLERFRSARNILNSKIVDLERELTTSPTRKRSTSSNNNDHHLPKILEGHHLSRSLPDEADIEAMLAELITPSLSEDLSSLTAQASVDWAQVMNHFPLGELHVSAVHQEDYQNPEHAQGKFSGPANPRNAHVPTGYPSDGSLTTTFTTPNPSQQTSRTNSRDNIYISSSGASSEEQA